MGIDTDGFGSDFSLKFFYLHSISHILYCQLNPRDWVRGLYKPALSDAKASLSDGFGALHRNHSWLDGRGAVSYTTGVT